MVDFVMTDVVSYESVRAECMPGVGRIYSNLDYF
jgi:hypothetical protein